MKNLITYLKALWRRGLDSQRKEVGVISEEGAIEHPFSTYSAPFGTCWQPSGKLHSVVRCAAMLVMLLTLGSGNAWGVEEVVYTLEPASGSNNSYTGNCDVAIDGITWNVTGNSTMVPWRIGGKNTSNTNRVIYSQDPIPANVSKIVITHGAKSNGCTVNSMTVLVSTAANGGGTQISNLTPTYVNNGTVTIERPAGKDWTGRYYKITYNYKSSSSKTNNYLSFAGAEFYAEAGSSCSAPAAPTISGTADYTAGETITLTASCASGTDASTTYAWYKGADWATARAASPVQAASISGATFTKASCTVDDAGTYWCEVSNGSGCEAHNSTGKAITVSAGGGGGGSDEYELVTNVGDLAAGDEIIILNTGGTQALSTTQNSNNRGQSNAFTLSGTTVTLDGDGVQVLTLGYTNEHWTFYTGSGYLYAASSGSNYLRTQAENDANGEWTITLNGDNEAIITAQGSNSRNLLRYNSGSSVFSCYGSGQIMVKIYKKEESGQTIYLKDNANWQQNDAKYAVYYWDNSTNGWSNFMTAQTDCESTWKTKIPEGYTNMKFVRFNPADATPGWNGEGHVWNETGNLTIPDGKDCFTLPAEAGSGSTNGTSDANWSAYAQKVTVSFAAHASPLSDPDNQCVVKTTGHASDVSYTRLGYSLTGWFTEEVGGDEWNFTTGTFSEDKTLHAHWTQPAGQQIYLKPSWSGDGNTWAKEGSVIFAHFYIDGTTQYQDIQMTGNSCDDVLTATAPYGTTHVSFARCTSGTVAGDLAADWGTNDHVQNYVAGLALAANYYYSITGWGSYGQKVGTAQKESSAYSPATFTIQYNDGGTSYTSGNTITGSHSNDTKNCGENLTLPGETFHTTGYTQTGWTTTAGSSETNALSGTYSTEAAQTFYPAWTTNTHTLTWNANGGDALAGDYTSGTVAYGTSIAAPNTPTRTGYTFQGWHNGTSIVKLATTMPDNNLTYTAQWTPKTDTYKTALHTGASGWTSYASGVEMSGANYAIPAPSSVAKGATSSCEDTHYHFAGWVTDANKEAGTISDNIIPATGTTDATGTTYWAVWEKEAAGGGSLTKLTSAYVPTEGDNLVIVAVDGDDKYALYQQTISSSYVAFWNFSNDAATVGADDKNYVTLVSDGGTGWYLGDATNGYVYNGSSNNLTVDASNQTSFSITWNSTGFNIIGNSRWLSCRTDVSNPNTNKYRMGGLTSGNASGTVWFDLYKYVGVSYEDPKAVCEACVATPSISGVELTGSAFSTTSVPVQATGASAGTNCSLASYGFYWGTAASPTGNNTPSDNLSTGTFSATLTGPFEIGTPYYYRAYATNEAPNTGYSSDGTFTLHNVTFNMHGHGDAKAAQVVPEGGKVTNPGNPSEAGYTFDGWWDNSSYTGSAWDFSTNTVGSGNVTLHAKWTEKPKYTITLNAGNGTISDANWTNTSGSTYTRKQANGDEEITLPTPSCNCAGWVFQGWSTTSKDNAASFTPDKEDGASFVPANNVTYYAVYRANATGGTTYNKITSTGDLTTGNYIFMSSGGYAMKNVVTSSRMEEVGDYTASNSSQTIDNANLVWTIAKFSSQVVIKNGANYLGIDADNNICLTTTPHFFTYTYNGTNSRWEFTSATLTDYQLAYSTAHGGSYSYFCIGTSQSTAIYLYKQGAGLTGNYYTNPDCSDISVTGVVSPEGSGTVTLTAGSGKTGDKVYAMYTPDEDYNFDEWSISGTGSTLGSTTAVVTEITIGSANTTVTANFVAKDWKTITWKANGVALTGGDLGSASVKVENGFNITNLPPEPSSCDGTSTTFMGWVEESDVWSGKTNDVSGVTIYEDVSDFPTVTDDVTYHAVWARQNGSAAPATYAGTGVFTKITTLEELEVGAHYVLYGEKVADNTINGAMNNTFSQPSSGKYIFGRSAVTISDSKITNPATTIVWKLGGEENAYTLYSQNSSKYVEITIGDARGYSNPSSPTTSFTIDVNEGVFRIMSNHASAGGRMISLYNGTEFRSYANNTTDYVLYLYKYGNDYTYDKYLVKCCEDPELAFDGEYNYQTLVRQDIHGAHGGNGSATAEQGKATLVLDYSTESGGTCTVEVKKLTGGDNRSTAAAGSSCANHTGIAINESTKKVTFDVWTYAGSYPTANGQGTYRIKITQDATSTYCAAETYYFVDVTLRDKFVDAVNGNATINVDGQSKSTTDFYKTPTEASLDGDKNDDCHSTTRRFLGWVREDNMDTWYGSSSDRTRDLDDKKDDAALVAPNADIITSGSTWYAIWGIEE